MKKQELTMEEIKDITYQAMVYFKQICEKYNLTYYLAYGTLLGAVRHGGYIPWDDDVDLLMPRRDYEKLLQLSNDIQTDDWELLSFKTNKDYCFPWAKLCHRKSEFVPSRFATGLVYGCPIDIFPLDSVPGASYEEACRNVNKISGRYAALVKQYKFIGVLRTGFINAVKRMIKRAVFKRSCRKYGSWDSQLANLEKEVIEMGGDEGNYTALLLYQKVKCAWKKSDFDNGTGFHYLKFHEEMFRVPCSYDAVLTAEYGDYMTPPPVSQQITHHTYKAYAKD